MKYSLMTSSFTGHLLMRLASSRLSVRWLVLAAMPLAACSAALCCRQGCTVAEALKTGMLSPEYQEKEVGKEK